MSRRKIIRKIYSKPKYKCFCPVTEKNINFEEIQLTLDEAEAVRLKDIKGYDQAQSAKIMGVSRVTYLRILKSARNKIAQCVIEGKKLNIGGGDCICQKNIKY